MKLSILTPSFNQGAFIEKTIESVLEQNWDNIEHIIIDAGSTDNTLPVLRKYPHLKWISEPDDGQADALNKGFKMASGDIIGWVNSDDYYKKNIFKNIIHIFKSENIDWVIGNVTHVYNSLNISYEVNSPTITYDNLIKNPDIVKQPATFFRRSALIKAGGWDKKFHMTMDYDLWLRLSKISSPKMVDKEWAYFTHHDHQKTSSKNITTQISNINTLLKREGVSWVEIQKILLKKYYYLIKATVKNALITFNFMDEKHINTPISIKKHKK